MIVVFCNRFQQQGLMLVLFWRWRRRRYWRGQWMQRRLCGRRWTFRWWWWCFPIWIFEMIWKELEKKYELSFFFRLKNVTFRCRRSSINDLSITPGLFLPHPPGLLWRLYRVFIKYCVFAKILKYIPDSGLSRFPLCVSECTQWQVKQKKYILRKNTIFKEHPVCSKY